MDKENMVYLPNGVSVTKKDEMMSLAGKWMEQEMIVLSEISQTQKDKYPMFSLTCGI
jgi:hypothetical protein